ncbi:Spo0B domain-containing protein [Heliophilum fasciatum]|uniref:Sensor kinase SpoOB-type protein n=1 Tax=Heliophilum fasciatum TaxID=35700 RepID=A0A4R2RXI4_9FIRM|nr:Spo0B domain-containing protein [Heliophilum fasciatum]MCW2277120.1 hypothetical protein [Heliophilum fasciatum]TCP68243.1 sensor kinase SpoOB-type protein [Heliophilum fasciatum]
MTTTLEQAFAPGAEDWLALWRHLRHDQVNHMQVILGYLQMGSTERAMNYARTTAAHLQEAGNVLAIGVQPVAIAIVIESHHLSRQGIELTVYVARDWDPAPWQSEGAARHLAQAALTAIQKAIDQRNLGRDNAGAEDENRWNDEESEANQLSLRFQGGSPTTGNPSASTPPSLIACWTHDPDNVVTYPLDTLDHIAIDAS